MRVSRSLAPYLNTKQFPNRTLLPKTIFPERKIGHLAEGFEASFLVLEGNPLEEFDHVKDITMRFKQGVDLAGVLEEGVQ